MNETTFAAFIVIAAIGLFLTSTPETKKEELTFPEVDSDSCEHLWDGKDVTPYVREDVSKLYLRRSWV